MKTLPHRPVVLTSPQCGGTHAVIGLLKCLGLELSHRHRDGFWYHKGEPKTLTGTRILQDRDIPIRSGQFATGHSGPFPTGALVISNLRDPRNIMICAWNRATKRPGDFHDWLNSSRALQRARDIPRHWQWRGRNVLTVWHEDIDREDSQRRIAAFCGVPWKSTPFYGRGKTWSGYPSKWQDRFGHDCAGAWDRLWQTLTAQSWDDWWHQNGPGT